MKINYGDYVDVIWHNGENKWQLRTEEPKRYETVEQFDIVDPSFFLKKKGRIYHGRVQGTYQPFTNKQGRKFYFKLSDGTFRYVDTDERIYNQNLPERLSFSLDNSPHIACAII